MANGGRDRFVPTVIDFEASGFGGDSYPIEVGYVLPSGQRFCALIRPQHEWEHWDKRAEAVHGVAREMLHSRGVPPSQICLRLEQDLAGQTVYTDAWSYDLSWLHRLYDAAEMTPGFRLESLRSLLNENEAAYWHTMLAIVRRNFAGARHRASSDAATIQRALCLLTGVEPPTLS